MRWIARLLATAVAAAAVAVAALIMPELAPAAAAKTVWLCLPGTSPDPCAPSLATTVFSPAGKRLGSQHPKRAKQPSIDCFYVYPTVSGQSTTLANFNIDPVERSIALYQAARYSQYCRVFAPIYRQLTLTGLAANPQAILHLAVPLSDVRSAFRQYLTKYNHGRGFVLIGHSQGSLVLRQLIARDIDGKPAVRKRLVSAILLGGNVLIKRGSGIGGDFKRIPACRKAGQLGCVVAFSTFDQTPPANSLFGRASKVGEAVLCTNPAALSGGSGHVDLISPSAHFYRGSVLSVGIDLLGFTYPKASTTWLSEPGAFRAKCSSAAGANVLEITPLHGAPTPKPSPDATWGLHLIDANIALGNLVQMVKTQAQAFGARWP